MASSRFGIADLGEGGEVVLDQRGNGHRLAGGVLHQAAHDVESLAQRDPVAVGEGGGGDPARERVAPGLGVGLAGRRGGGLEGVGEGDRIVEQDLHAPGEPAPAPRGRSRPRSRPGWRTGPAVPPGRAWRRARCGWTWGPSRAGVMTGQTCHGRRPASAPSDARARGSSRAPRLGEPAPGPRAMGRHVHDPAVRPPHRPLPRPRAAARSRPSSRARCPRAPPGPSALGGPSAS